MKKIKEFFHKISNRFFYGKYKTDMLNSNKIPYFKKYFLLFIVANIIAFVLYYLIFINMYISLFLMLPTALFYINRVYLNEVLLEHKEYILHQISVYISEVTMLVNFNNVYGTLNKVIPYLDTTMQNDLKLVIKDIESGKNINQGFEVFNKKYNTKILTQFNKSLAVFSENGDSESTATLYSLNEQFNNLKIIKNKYLLFKKGFRKSYYIVLLMSYLMPLLVKEMIPDIYLSFINSWGALLLFIVVIVNIKISSIVEFKYLDQDVEGENYE